MAALLLVVGPMVVMTGVGPMVVVTGVGPTVVMTGVGRGETVGSRAGSDGEHAVRLRIEVAHGR